ncbi:unnamed protein product [Rotaria socialis]|uniref:Uncharacterized protein n=1 Tax=Rotaria socialis TaxID=392032 RepID=A0A817KUX5_9BILA|nr:unnamed protein product [Rotaria socialis]CAF4101118.1 unnamed protein product [Rotaria socialis]
MQVTNRTTRRYITPPVKNQTGNRSNSKKHSNTPTVSHISPKKIVDIPVPKSDEPSTLKKLVDRFRYEEPEARPERDSKSFDFWWLHDELKTNYTNTEDNDEVKSNIPEFIEIFPSTDIDQDLNKRASLLLNQTFSAQSSDIGHVSSTGIGSTPSTTLTATTATSIFQPVVYEKPARPMFTRNLDSNFNFVNNDGDDDILYQWRLRRRLEQAHNDEPITFPTRINNRTNVSPAHLMLPSVPIEISTVLPRRTPSPPATKPLSPKREAQQSTITTIETEHVKQLVTTPIPIRQYSEAATQTIQDACIQTSLTIENHLSASTGISNEIDLRPTRDNDHQSSIWHRPPPRSKCEITRTSSPSPVKRHHHHHHHHQKSMINSSNIVQSSQDSTLTQVTSIVIHDSNNNNNNNNTANHGSIKNNTSIATMDDFHEQRQDNDDDDDGHIDYLNDEILNILIRKRDELLVAFREIEQNLGQSKF